MEGKKKKKVLLTINCTTNDNMRGRLSKNMTKQGFRLVEGVALTT
jgi:hypothetical protein